MNVSLLKKQIEISKDSYKAIPKQSNIISFSLFGTDEYYIKCFERLLDQIFSFHKDIKLIIHCDNNNFKELQKIIHDYKYKKIIHLINLGEESFPFCGLLWRLFPLEYGFQSVSIRDADTQWTKRDAELLNHWLISSFEAHIIRDDYGQDKEIMGGLWGIKSKKIRIIDAYISFIKIRIKNNYSLYEDQDFLAMMIYPFIAKFAICYCSCNLYITDNNIYRLREPCAEDTKSGEIFSMGQQPSDFAKYITEDNNEKYYGLSKNIERQIHFNKNIREKNYKFKIFTPRIASLNFFKNIFLLFSYYIDGFLTFKEFLLRNMFYFLYLKTRFLIKLK